MFGNNFSQTSNAVGYIRKIKELLKDKDFNKFSQIVTCASFQHDKSHCDQQAQAAITSLIQLLLQRNLDEDSFFETAIGLNSCLSLGHTVEKTKDGKLYYRSASGTNTTLHLVFNNEENSDHSCCRKVESKDAIAAKGETRNLNENIGLKMSGIDVVECGPVVGEKILDKRNRPNGDMNMLEKTVQDLEVQNQELLQRIRDFGLDKEALKTLGRECEVLRSCIDELESANFQMAERLRKVRELLQPLQSDFKCPICLETQSKTYVVPDCLHRFCKECIETSLRKCKNECPQCRIFVSTRRGLRPDKKYEAFVQSYEKILGIVGEDCPPRQILRRSVARDGKSKGFNAATSQRQRTSKVRSQYQLRSNCRSRKRSLRESKEASAPHHGSTKKRQLLDTGIKMKAAKRSKPRNNIKISENSFNIFFQRLKNYKDTFGCCDVNKTYDKSLWKCCNRRRKANAGAEPEVLLTDEMIEKLNSIGFNWSPSRASEESKSSTELSSHRGALTPLFAERRKCHTIGSSVNLSTGLSEKLPSQNEKSSSKKMLEQPADDDFDTYLNRLEHFQMRHGHCKVRWSSSGSDVSLYKWCNKMRRAYIALVRENDAQCLGSLTFERIQKLTSIGFEFEIIGRASDSTRSKRSCSVQLSSKTTRVTRSNTRSNTNPRVQNDSLQQRILESKDRLFFVKFTPSIDTAPRWYLIQVDLESTQQINSTFREDGNYYCSFLAKHPEDMRKHDDTSRWWPDWYRYTTCKRTGQVIYGCRILLHPNSNPDDRKYVEWATDLNLFITKDSDALLGPFDFEPISPSNAIDRKVSQKKWRELSRLCIQHGIQPPTF